MSEEQVPVVSAPRGVPLPEVEIWLFKERPNPSAVSVRFGGKPAWMVAVIHGEIQEDKEELLKSLVKLAHAYRNTSDIKKLKTRVLLTKHTGPEGGLWLWEVTSLIDNDGDTIAHGRFRRWAWKPEGGSRAKNSIQA